MAQLSSAVHDLLNREAGFSPAVQNAQHVHGVDLNRCDEPDLISIKRNRVRVDPVAPHLIHEGTCRCGSCSTGMSRSVGFGCGDGCDSSSGVMQDHSTAIESWCPDGTIPWDVHLVKTDFRFSALWECFDFQEAANVLDSYSDYHIPGKSISVPLAASHYIFMHSTVQNSIGLALSRESSLGRALATVHGSIIHNTGAASSGYFDNTWTYSSWGIEYKSLYRGATALAGQAWGI